MAKLYITEYAEAALPQSYSGSSSNPYHNFPLPAGKEPATEDQTPVAIGAGSLQSAPFAKSTRFIRLMADAVCSIAIGSNPTATANNQRLAANVPEWRGVKPGDVVAVITNT